MMEPSLLRELIAEAKAGDLRAFERIVVLHQSVVLRVAQRLLLNGEDAKDAAQEVFLRLHRSLGQFREDSDFPPWLYRMTVNICHDVRRRRRPEIALDGAMEVADVAPSAEERVVFRQQQELVLAALGSLTEREREVIVLRDLEGLSTAEVAKITGVIRDHRAFADFHGTSEDQELCNGPVGEAFVMRHVSEEQLALYVDGEFWDGRSAVEEHLRGCANCQGLLAELQESRATLLGSFREPAGEELRDVRLRVVRRLEGRKQAARIWVWGSVMAAVAIVLAVLLFPRQPRSVPVTQSPRLATASLQVPYRPVVWLSMPDIPKYEGRISAKHQHNPAPGLRSVTLLAEGDGRRVLRMTTTDPDVVILWQLNERIQGQ